MKNKQAITSSSLQEKCPQLPMLMDTFTGFLGMIENRGKIQQGLVAINFGM